jgi:hypothetical protein
MDGEPLPDPGGALDVWGEETSVREPLCPGVVFGPENVTITLHQGSFMRAFGLALLGAVGFGLAVPSGVHAQEPSSFLAVGEMAPDIQVQGATRYGTLAEPVRLSDFGGETAVVAFFFKARTGG